MTAPRGPLDRVQERRQRLRERARAEFVAGAEEEHRRLTGRPMKLPHGFGPTVTMLGPGLDDRQTLDQSVARRPGISASRSLATRRAVYCEPEAHAARHRGRQRRHHDEHDAIPQSSRR
jgi:hypothetical protein